MSIMRNTSILASAGTGKTFQLSDRIVKLLALGVKHEEIAALTFTRAAAAEFIVKVIAKLREAAEDEKSRLDLCGRLKLDASKFDQKKFREMLRQALLSSNRLTMGTLDGFFAKLVNNFPLEVGLNTGSATTIPDQEIVNLRLQALQIVIESLDGPAAATLLANLRDYNDGMEVANPLESMAEMAKDYHELLVSSDDVRIWGNEALIWPDKQPCWTGYATKVDAAKEWAIVDAYTRRQFGEDPAEWPADFQDLAEAAGSERTTNSIANGLVDYFGDVFVVEASHPSQIYHRENIAVDGATSDAIRNLLLRTVDQLVSARLRQTKALHRCLSAYEKAYDETNRRTGLLGFSDYVTLLTKADPFKKEEIEYRLDCSIKHWLLDEFQDTSAPQFQVLARNIDEIIQTPEDRTVFVVGDLKQSLYEWRSGNRKLLSNLHARIGANKDHGENLNLDETRRCAPAVLALVNGVLLDHETKGFGRFYSPVAAQDWSATFHPQNAVVETGKPVKKGDASWVRMTRPAGMKEHEDPGIQALWIAAHIKATTGLLAQSGRLTAGLTCAILVSKNDHAAQITEVLRKNGVEATDEAKGSVIEDNPVTAGLLALIQTTVHPDNGLAKGLAEISPASARFLKAHGGWDGASPLIAQTFISEGAEALADLLAKSADLSEDKGFIRKRLGQFRSVAVDYDNSRKRDLGDFAGYCAASQLRDSADPQTVQVITIHRSKGLEYDVVYMPCLNNSKQPIASIRTGDMLSLPTSDSDFKPRWLLANVGGNVARLDAVLGAATDRAKAENAYGNLCRLYVGMTRAKHRLVMITMQLSEEQAKKKLVEGNGKHDFACLLESALAAPDKVLKLANLITEANAVIAWEAPEGDPSWLEDRISEAGRKAASKSGKPRAIEVPKFKPAELVEKLRPSKSTAEKQFAWRPSVEQNGGRELGTVVHAILQLLERDVDDLIAGLDRIRFPNEHLRLRDKALELTRNCLGNPAVRELLSDLPEGAQLWQERQAALMHDGKMINAIFDRVHVIPGKSATVIDYKTNDCSLAQLKEKYQAQMDLYRIAVAKLCGLSPEKVRCVLVHVRLGALIEA